jgi:hypothetical protein
MGVLGAPKWSVNVDMGTLPEGGSHAWQCSIDASVVWLEVQIPACLADATQSGIQWCKHRAGGKVAIFSILYAINLKKKRFTLQNKKLITVFWQKPGRPR